MDEEPRNYMNWGSPLFPLLDIWQLLKRMLNSHWQRRQSNRRMSTCVNPVEGMEVVITLSRFEELEEDEDKVEEEEIHWDEPKNAREEERQKKSSY